MQSIAAKYFGYNLDLLFEGLEDYNHVLVAVSGGSDSVALLYLLHDWAKARVKPKLSVATVDHCLRIESAREAEQVGLIADKLGLQHIIGKWEGEKPSSAVSQNAREARYALLSKIAHDVGANAIALGHNRDDQRETILMRAQRMKFCNFDKSPDEKTNLGLAGMRPLVSYSGLPEFSPVDLVRPVLSIAREKLQLFLKRMGENWIEDPSNEDEHYERVRLRKELGAHRTKFPTAYQIGKFADKVAAHREHLASDCAKFMAQNVWWPRNSNLADGVFAIGRSAFINMNQNLMCHLLRTLIGVAGGRNFLVSPEKAMRLTLDIQSGSLKRHCLGSVIIEPKKDRIQLWRESRNLPVIKLCESSENIISWDGRIVYRFLDEHLKQNLELKALGENGVATIEDCLQRRLDANPRQALFSQPAVFKNDQVVFAPMLPWCTLGFEESKYIYWAPALQKFELDCDFALMETVLKLRYPVDISDCVCKA